MCQRSYEKFKFAIKKSELFLQAEKSKVKLNIPLTIMVYFILWLIPSLEKNCTPVIAVTITAIVFGILHLFSSGVTVLSFINLMLSGIFFASFAIADGNIWGVCGLHFAWNFALGNIYGLPVSGYTDNGERLFQAQRTGSNILTGGDFGPEGGIITTIILLITIIVLILKLRKDSKYNSARKIMY